MQIQEATALLQVLRQLMADPKTKSVKFSYALARNRRELEKVVQDYNEVLNKHADPDLDAFIAECRTVAPEYAAHDAEGNPLTQADGNITIDPAKLDAFNQHCDRLMHSKPEWVAAYEARNKLVQELLATEADVSLYPIKLDQIPDHLDTVTVDALFPLIEA